MATLVQIRSKAETVRRAKTAKWFHALSDEIRLEIVSMLTGGERCVCELMEELDMAQSRLSWHLKTLVDAGIVTTRRDGRWNFYTLVPEALAEAHDILVSFKPTGRRLNVRCCYLSS